MSMYTPPQQDTRPVVTHSLLGLWCAWVSLFLPIAVGCLFLFARLTMVAAPDVIYWAMFICGAISFVLGCVGVSTTRRRVDWLVLTPAILGIVLSLAMCYFALAFGILASAGRVPRWDQIFPWQGPPPGQHW